MTRQPTSFWLVLISGILLRVFIALKLPLYSADNPANGYNDEPMHLNYIRYISEWRRLPVWTEAESRVDPLIDEFPQPPVYYVIATPAYKFAESLNAGSGLVGARLVSIFFGIIAALIVYWVCQKLLNDRTSSLAGFVFMLFSPNPVIFSSIVTNDSALMAFSSLSFASILLVRNNVGGSIRQIKTGLLAGTAVWMKMSAVSLIPLLWFGSGKGSPAPNAWIQRERAFVIALAVISPLIVWNLAHYGQLIPTVSIYTPEEINVTTVGVKQPVAALIYLARSSCQPIQQVWGGLIEKTLTSLWLLFGAIFFSAGIWSMRKSEERWLLLTGLALPFMALMIYNFRFFQIEARLLAPASAPISVLIAAGMSRLRIPVGWQCLIWGAPLAVIFLGL